MDQFFGFLAEKGDKAPIVTWKQLSTADLMDGDVTVRVTHSTLNYKDALALTGRGPIIRKWPLIPGIDLAGTVTASGHADFKAGDDVILNGWGVGEAHHGGYAQMARLKGDWLVKRPAAFDRAQTMALGTAGYTAMLCVMALDDHGVTPDKGPVLVTGASGGVGSVAVGLLAKRGFLVIAATGRPEEEAFLKSLGAAEILDRKELAGPARPLNKERWAGVVDVAGSHTLANAISMTRYGGTVAATGLAHGMDLPGSVAPFILRGVTLAGVDSVMAPIEKRRRAWERLARELDAATLAKVTETRPLTDVPQLAVQLLDNKLKGRIVLEVPAQA